jgi:chemotaxis protein methyltransferase WspC
MIHSRIELLLKQAMGLDAASIGSPAVAQAVTSRLSACELNDTEAYQQKPATEPGINQQSSCRKPGSSVIARPSPSWAALLTRSCLPIRGVLVTAEPARSSGEEPHTMAMAPPLDARFPAMLCRIDAVDISTQSWARAVPCTEELVCMPSKDSAIAISETMTLGRRLCDEVRQQVQLRYGNLFAETFCRE